MSSQPPETETHEITLSTDEQWVVHAVLAGYIDDALEADENPPAWALGLFDVLESGDGTEELSSHQAQRLYDAMTTYVESEATPERDLAHGLTVIEQLEAHLECETV